MMKRFRAWCYRQALKDKNISPELKKQLTKEAKSEHRSFTNYIEMLLATHQSRQAVTKQKG